MPFIESWIAFFEKLHHCHPATPSAFVQARMKLLPSAFVALRQLVAAKFYHQCIGQRWHGLRLLAVDGSRARLDGVGNDCRDFFDPGPRRMDGAV